MAKSHPLVLSRLKVEIYGTKASILYFGLAQASHRLAAGALDFSQPPFVQGVYVM